MLPRLSFRPAVALLATSAWVVIAACGGGGAGPASLSVEVAVTNVTFSPQTQTIGATFTVSAVLTNSGTDSSNSIMLDFFISTDQTKEPSDTLVASQTISSLAGKTSKAIAAQTTPEPGTVPEGSYYVIASCRFVQTPPGENPGNNVAVSSTKILLHSDIDLIPSSVSFSPTSGVRCGEAIQVTDTVTKVGTSNIPGPFKVGIYLSDDQSIDPATDLLLGDRTIASISTISTGSGSLTIPTSVTPGRFYFIAAYVDYDDAILENIEYNNVQLASPALYVSSCSLPDLRFTTFSATPSQLCPGDPITVTEEVLNAGTVNAGTFDVALYLSPDAVITTADTPLGARLVASLAAGQRSGSTTPVNIPSITPGTYYVGGIIDPSNSIGETNESNNSALAGPITISSCPLPDLKMTSIFLSKTSANPGETFRVSVGVSNRGKASSPGFEIGVFLFPTFPINPNDPNKKRLGHISQSGLAVNASQNLFGDFTVPCLPGTHYAVAWADDKNVVAEEDESNNLSAAIPFTINNTCSQPDITLAQLSHSYSACATQITVNYQLCNLNQNPAGSFAVGFYLSTNSSQPQNAVLLGSASIASLAGNACSPQTGTSSQQFNIPGQTPPGSWWVVGVADDGQQITETNENNNTNGSGSQIFLWPDLTVSALAGAPSTQPAGGQITATGAIRNNGPSGAGGQPTVDFYLAQSGGCPSGTKVHIWNAPSLTGANGTAPQATFNQTVSIPGSLLPGNYFLQAVTTPPPGVQDCNTANDCSQTIGQITIICPTSGSLEVPATGTAVAGDQYTGNLCNVAPTWTQAIGMGWDTSCIGGTGLLVSLLRFDLSPTHLRNLGLPLCVTSFQISKIELVLRGWQSCNASGMTYRVETSAMTWNGNCPISFTQAVNGLQAPRVTATLTTVGNVVVDVTTMLLTTVGATPVDIGLWVPAPSANAVWTGYNHQQSNPPKLRLSW